MDMKGLCGLKSYISDFHSSNITFYFGEKRNPEVGILYPSSIVSVSKKTFESD